MVSGTDNSQVMNASASPGRPQRAPRARALAVAPDQNLRWNVTPYSRGGAGLPDSRPKNVIKLSLP